MHRGGLPHGDCLVEAAEITECRSILDGELYMPVVVETELKSALVLCAGFSLESHGVVHAREFERRPAALSRASISQSLHRCHAAFSIEGVEAPPEIGDGG